MTQPYRFIVLSLLAAALCVAPASAQTRDAANLPVVVTSGEAIVRATPDRAFVSISAESRAQSPREAQQRNAELMKPVQDRLRAAGIPAEAIRTTVYDLRFEYDYDRGRRIPRGYVARNTIEVRVDDVEKLGTLLDTAVEAGATTVSNIRFDLKDRDKLEREALRRAVADARARAEVATAAAGTSIDRVIRIVEEGVVSPPPMPMMRQAMAEAQPAADTPIAPGEMEIQARVTLTFALK